MGWSEPLALCPLPSLWGTHRDAQLPGQAAQAPDALLVLGVAAGADQHQLQLGVVAACAQGERVTGEWGGQ